VSWAWTGLLFRFLPSEGERLAGLSPSRFLSALGGGVKVSLAGLCYSSPTSGNNAISCAEVDHELGQLDEPSLTEYFWRATLSFEFAVPLEIDESDTRRFRLVGE
jgi:hypothetical protein